MRIVQKKTKTKFGGVFAFTILTIGVLTASASGAIVMTLTDDGTNLTMTATGTYDFTGATQTLSFETDYDPAFASPFFFGGTYGWATGNNVISYEVSFSSSFTNLGNTGTPPPTTLTTTVPFYFQYLSTAALSGPVIRFAQGSPVMGTVSETAFFANTTLADIGMVSGETVTASWSGDSATIQTISVPEPSSTALLVGCVAIGVAALRRRIR